MIEQSEKFNEAFEFHKQGDLERAKDLYLSILQDEKDNAIVWNFLGVAHYQSKDYIEAELSIKKAIELNPRLYYIENLARVYLDKGDYELAPCYQVHLVNQLHRQWSDHVR